MGEYLPERVIEALRANSVPKLRFYRRYLGLFDPNGSNLLHVAILSHPFQRTSMIDAFEYLLTRPEIDKDHVNMEGHSPLQCAFVYAKSDQRYAIKLIESGCDLTINLGYGSTPLHLAVQNNWPEAVELLIEKGVDIDVRNTNNETALFVAARHWECIDMIWMLLFYGADPQRSRVLEIIFSGTDDELLFTYLTFFDVIYNYHGHRFLGRFANCYKTFSLSTFVEAMRNVDLSFYRLINCTNDIYYGIDDMNFFLKRVFEFDSKMFRRFVQKFSYIIEEAFQNSIQLDEFFFCYKPTKLQNFCENLFTLLESDIVSSIVDKINVDRLPLMMHLIKSFAIQKDQKELLTQVLCCFLSHGVDMTTEAMNELYLSFGYCDLFKIMLHMDITECKISTMPVYFWPNVIYCIQMDFDDISNCADYDDVTFSAYYTTPAVYHLRVPSLAELTRYATRRFIKRTYNTRNSRQFYTVLKKLELADQQKAIVSFENKIYFEDIKC